VLSEMRPDRVGLAVDHPLEEVADGALLAL
jgi:hypothetical protein